MGSTQLAGMREMVGDDCLEWHLTSNHYPPLPTILIDACREALAALRNEEPDREIYTPEGVQFRNRNSATASEIADSAHLWGLV